MCTYVKFMLTQNVTVTGHYLSLCLVSLALALFYLYVVRRRGRLAPG